MKVTVEANELVLRLPLNNPPRPPRNRKNFVVASSSRNMPTDATVNDQ
jgi:hypothetical protein